MVGGAIAFVASRYHVGGGLIFDGVLLCLVDGIIGHPII
jgi:hypothetical protein